MSQALMPASYATSTSNASAAPFSETGFASTAFLILCSALVFLMTPGVGLLYSGLSSSKNALSILMLSMLSYAVVMIQWTLFGFSLAFSETGSFFMGNFDFGGLENVGAQALLLTAPQVPAVVFALYQMQFATVTVAIIFGAASERIRILPAILFMFVWTTIIYDPIAYWTWAGRGWLRNLACLDTIVLGSTPCGLGVFDFAGGGPVHMASGFAGLAYAIMLGKRIDNSKSSPHNMTSVFLGTSILWLGWFGFNGGSALSATPRAAMAALVTTIAGGSGALGWVVVDAMRTKKISGLGFCCGAIAGLVGVTPAAGFVAPWAAIIIGLVTAVGCNLGCTLKDRIGADDALDSFYLHGVGGFIGNILTGIFAQKNMSLLDGTTTLGGAIDGHAIQIAYQFTASASIAVYSFFGTFAILYIINLIPGMKLRASLEHEEIGGDLHEMGEVAYGMISASKSNETMMASVSTKDILEEIV